MNIKSNKEKKSFWNLNVGNFIGGLVKNSKYWLTAIVWFIFTIMIIALNGTWGIHLVITIMAILIHLVVVGVSENNRVDNLRWNDITAHLSIFSIFGIPFIIVGLSYWNIIVPMYDDYKHSDRINRVLPMDEVKLFYNDENSIFVMFIEGQKQPLILSQAGHSDTYNKLKADYLDNKIKVVKKETKSWSDDNSSIQYHLDGYTFN